MPEENLPTAIKKTHHSEVAQKATDKYYTLFNSIDEGFCIIKTIFNEYNICIDYRFLEVNPAFIKQTSLENVVGKNIRSLAPNLEKFWFEMYGDISKTGESKRFEHFASEISGGVWYSVYAFRIDEPEQNHVAILFENITQRKQRELSTDFLDKISKELVTPFTPEEIMLKIGAMVGEFMQLSGCVFVNVDEERNKLMVHYGWMAEDVPSLIQTFKLSDYLTEEFSNINRSGNAFIVHNTATDKRTDAEAYANLKVGSFITMPFHSHGRWTGYIGITSTQPRHWRDDEVKLLSEITNRLFLRIEQVTAEEALRLSEAQIRKQKEAFQSAINGFPVADSLKILSRMVIEESKKEVRTAFFIVNRNGTKLYSIYGAGNMPDAYMKEVDGFPINADSPACGLAVPKGEPVLTADVLEEPLWKPWTFIAEKYNYRSCWSFPVKTKENKAIGSFAMYFNTPNEPTPQDIALADVVTQSAGVIISNYIGVKERDRAESALRKSEERFQLATKAAKMGTFVYYVKEDRGEPDEQMLSLFGLPTDAKLNLTDVLSYIIHPEDRKRYAREVEDAIQSNGNGKLDTDVRIVHPDGSLHWIHITAQTQFEGNPLKPTKMPGVAIDITERKLLEQQKEDFIGIASHELKTPVTSIKVYAEILEDLLSESGNTELNSIAIKLNKQVDRLSELIKSLLNTTRIVEGKLAFVFEWFNINDMIKDCVADLQLTTNQHKIIFNNNSKVFVYADKEKIGQVLTNLISNAIKYSPKKGDIIVTSCIINNGVQVSIKDNGIGIPDNALDKIFDRFYRVGNEQLDTYPGMGLGLYISTSIIKSHGGKMWVESKLNEGSTFYFFLPKAN